MEKRAHQQLRLQETVEGLSVVAISYYGIGIVTKLIDALGERLHADVKLAEIIAIPLVIAIVWGSIRRMRYRILRPEVE